MAKPVGAYQFAGFVLDTVTRNLSGHGHSEHLPPKLYELLLLFLRQPGVLQERETLLHALWPNVIVEEGNLNHLVSQLRRLFAPSPSPPRIENVPKVGYIFHATVHFHPNDGSHRRRLLFWLLGAIAILMWSWSFYHCGRRSGRPTGNHLSPQR